ncbi:hypothetical protein [Agrococcus jejuensis]|uniref:Nucleoside 2-deoxyribosyltransferase n=1 Tax=Agrococcus jejuensis TaxID=399736 RepID=A0A1G8GCN2_9MICO|nr:hypothetical protein [Agrococcus jejuensis]SDH92124.1 hypothetical protein SAMN04489720_2863 [Agrococcus jejuensis]
MADEKRVCFVISPIGEDGSEQRSDADKVIKHLIRKAIGSEYDVRRSDGDSNPGAITPTIVASIMEADLVVADLSGFNPNVYYELAIAHGYAKPTVHIQKNGERAAFDVKDMRIVRYNLADPDDLEAAQKRLKDSAHFATTSPEKVENPLTSASRFAQVTESTDPVAESNVRVIEAIDALAVEVRRSISRSNPSRPSSASSITRSADNRSLRTIADRAARRGALSPADMSSVITDSTSTEFDRWAREVLARVVELDPEADADELNQTLMTAEILNRDDAPF